MGEHVYENIGSDNHEENENEIKPTQFKSAVKQNLQVVSNQVKAVIQISNVHASENKREVNSRFRSSIGQTAEENAMSLKSKLEMAESTDELKQLLSDPYNAYDLHHIEALNFSNRKLNIEDIYSVVNCPHLTSLTILNFSGTQITTKRAQVIAESPILKNIRSLILQNTILTVNGLSLILKSENIVNLVYLDLSYNTLGDRGLRVVLNSSISKKLTRLDMSASLISDVGAKVVASSFLPNIRTLNLSCNFISDTGAIALASATHRQFDSLRKVFLTSRYNGENFYFSKETERLLQSRFPDIEFIFEDPQ